MTDILALDLATVAGYARGSRRLVARRSTALIWVCQPGPNFRKWSSTSGSRRSLIASFGLGLRGRPPRLTTAVRVFLGIVGSGLRGLGHCRSRRHLQLDDDRRWGGYLPKFEADGAGDCCCHADQESNVARVLPDVLLAPQIYVGHEQLLSPLFFFIVGHPIYVPPKTTTVKHGDGARS